jgi:hypothetical protein
MRRYGIKQSSKFRENSPISTLNINKALIRSSPINPAQNSSRARASKRTENKGEGKM